MLVKTIAIEIANNDGEVITIRKNEDGPGIIISIDGNEWWIEQENICRFADAVKEFPHD